MQNDPPFDPPYKTFVKTDKGVFVTETLADGTTLELGEAPMSDFNASNSPAASTKQKRNEPAAVKAVALGDSKAAMYLNVPFADKDKAKSKGARWDATKKKWYAPHGTDLNDFEPWWPEGVR
ncbi:DUF5710 domain-containing protein [Herbaspirillum sp. alder98]|uniref:DUF5710 domain-containing protein n=1 Tax=Herbaspirillum sp. alder98 TaxID=2913096 RepID=UPI001CD8AD26|nr:DUF5710 domain-containing protein [Herbaspirillum sp. alder98]MCA1326843.1 DUF5710 domain-containing protein [Herbaspirillum sp. alder98]